MTNYIIPQIIKYQNIDDLLENNNKARSLFDTGESLSIDELLQENFVCVVGEPGIGKSRLVDEMESLSSNKTLFSCKASEIKTKPIPAGVEYSIIDALDEVEGNVFFSTLQLIKDYKVNNPDVKVLFTCRKHYVASYANHFASCKDLFYVELYRLNNEDVMREIDRCSEITKANITKSPKLRELLRIPRYLTFLLEHEEQRGDCTNIGELFEFIIGKSILNAVESRYGDRKTDNKNENLKILIQRVLEKVAFIMEVSRKDQISKDELYTIFDEVRGNMTQMIIANFDILYFESRILRDTNGVLQFDNTELQEYLAAKELCRQDNIESVLYDVAVQKDLKHIYPNWYDVIPHISYVGDKAVSFMNIIKLIVSYESSLDNEEFVSLLRYVDPSMLEVQQKADLFSLILEHYLRIPIYIGWRAPILTLIQECYCPKCNDRLKPPYGHFNKIQLTNMCSILEAVVEKNILDKDVFAFWINAANVFIQDDEEEKKLMALNIYNALNDLDNLRSLSDSFSVFSPKVKEKYCEITGYGKFKDKVVVDCWLSGCYERDPYAINAILCIEDPSIMVYAYKRIIGDNKLHEFFNPTGAILVCYESYLKKQFDIIWNGDSERKQLITKIVAGFVFQESCTIHDEMDVVVKKILLEEETGAVFINCFDEVWHIERILARFDTRIVDAELISALDKLLHDAKTEDWCVDIILTNLINKIRNDESKKTSISEYLTRYAKTFDRWDKNSEEEANRRLNNPSDTKAYQSLSDPSSSKSVKYNAAYKLSKNIDYLQRQNPQPFVNVIETFLGEMDLNEMILEKKEDNSFTISTMLVMLPHFIRAMYHLGFHNQLKKHRIFLAKILPISCIMTNTGAGEIKYIYKSVIGSISDEEKTELINWWQLRKDDFMKISSDSVFACITDYGFNALSYKLEEYINDYVQQQDLAHKLVASKALELISKGYLNWSVEKYRSLFNALNEDDIESVKLQCNAIMIEKYQDTEAITWRVEYLKRNVLNSVNNNTGHVRAISIAESEMISPHPQMFRCFIHIKGNELLEAQMLTLFDFGLSLFDKPDKQEYASYLLRQIYLFFINTDNGIVVSDLRKKVEVYSAKNVSPLVYNIMINAEMMYLNKEKISIDKAIKQYNKCVNESHLEIRNNGDLRRYFTRIHSEVQKEIQDQGIYSLVQGSLSEDFIQRELKNTIINKCCQMGLDIVQVDREVALQDNKRTDLLIRYGFCNPVMVELKLLHNKEIQNIKNRHDYKSKFIQYTKATNACLSVFWVFDVHKKGNDIAKFKDLEEEYKDLDNTRVLLTDCKCSSGFDTGLSVNKQSSMLNKKGKERNRK